MYPNDYHAACAYLVTYGGHGPNRAAARLTIARALRWLRIMRGPARARHERRSLLFIAGHFPVKE